MKLNWSKIDWERFQEITIHIAESKYPECDFQLYLKKGQKQEGLDIKTFYRKDSSCICIECKHYTQLEASNLDQIVKKFLEGHYNDKTRCLILSTTADLQKPELQEKITELQIGLSSERGLQFECWDKTAIETILRNYWSVVAYYFSHHEADEHCLPQGNYDTVASLAPMPNYIPRRVVPYPLRSADISPHQTNYSILTPVDLADAFLQTRIQSRNICLLADAYQGKSFYLKHLAYRLKESGKRYCPLILEIKEHTIQPIESLLEKKYRAWKQIPVKDLVIIVDGLDEAPTDKFDEIAKHIFEFTLSYPSVNFIFSCRTLFFNEYSLNTLNKDFDIYELYPLQYSDIISHVQEILAFKRDDFIELTRRNGIYELLYYPFYLIEFLKDYKTSPENLPTSRVAALKKVIDGSFSRSENRKIGNGALFRQKKVTAKQAMQKFAFALQLAGANSFDEEEMQTLLEDAEIGLLRHNSLVVFSNSKWSFINAMFQEHLAALMLSQLPFNDILSFVTVGKSLKKIKIKWIQTFSSLLSFTSKDLFVKLLELLRQDNIELIFTTEKSKYGRAFKIEMLKELIERCIRLNIRPTLIHEYQIGGFVSELPEAAEYLLSCLDTDSVEVLPKIICSEILYNVELSDRQRKTLHGIVDRELIKTQDAYYSCQLIELLAKYKIGSIDDVKKWASLVSLNQQHEFRKGVYQLVASLGYVDEFYEYALDGFQILENYNKPITHYGSEFSMENLLLSTNSRENIAKLLKLMQSDEWIEFYRYDSSPAKFLGRLQHKLSRIYSQNPLIILDVVDFEKLLVEKHLRDEIKQMEEFFTNTCTKEVALRILLPTAKENFGWHYASLLTEDAFDYLLYEFEEGTIEMKGLRFCIIGLRQIGKNDLADRLYTLSVDATEGQISQPDSDHDYFVEHQNRKHQNDIEYIQSAEAFKGGVMKYFTEHGKRSISEDELYIERNYREAKRAFESDFVLHFLFKLLRNDNRVALKDCLQAIENWFEYFRADEILNYSFSGKDGEDILLNILQDYYYKGLKTATFRNSRWENEGKVHWKRKELQLTKIFEKFQFETSPEKLMEMVWMDNGGMRSFKTSDLNNQKSLSQLIILHLPSNELEQFKKYVLDNIQSGIKSLPVLENHLEICKHLHITEARESILTIIYNQRIPEYHLHDAIDIFLSLHGDLENLVDLFLGIQDSNQYYYTYLANKLKETNLEIVMESLLKFLNHTTTLEENRVQIAMQLSEMGVKEGFVFLVDKVRVLKKSPYHSRGNFQVHNVDTAFALGQLEDVIYLLLDPEYKMEDSFHESARQILIEWMYGFASKTELDLLLVEEFLNNCRDNLKDTYPNASDINWYISRAVDNFRNSSPTQLPLTEIKRLIKEHEAVPV